MMTLLGWILTASCVFQSDTPPVLRVKHKELISPRGGASFITALDANTLLTVDSRFIISLWEFKEKEKVKQIASLPAEHIFGSFDYCHSSRTFAFSNSASINNAIWFYSISAERQFTKRKHLKLPFGEGATMHFRFSPKGSMFAYSSYEERAIKLLDGKTFDSTQSIRFPKYVSELFFLDESLLLAISVDDHASVWDISRSPAKQLNEFIIPKRGHEMLGMTATSSQKKAVVYYISKPGLAIGQSDIDFKVNVTVENKVPRFAHLTRPGWLFCVSPGSKTLVVGDIDGNLRVVDLVGNKLIVERKLDDLPWSACFISDNYFLVGCLRGHLYSFSLE